LIEIIISDSLVTFLLRVNTFCGVVTGKISSKVSGEANGVGAVPK
jgi:hypothetical protein